MFDANDITDNERKVLDYCRAYVRDNGNFPTQRKIQARFGWASQNSARQYIAQLEAKGYIARDEDNRHTIKP